MMNLQELDKPQLRQFAFILGLGIAVIFGLIFPLLFSGAWRIWPWGVAVFLGLWGMLFPISLRPIYQLWMWFGILLGWVNTRLLLGMVFYLVMTPLRLIRWRFRREFFAPPNPIENTYRYRSQIRPSKHMEYPF